MTKAFEVRLADDSREAILDDNYTDVGADSFGEACFDAMMLSDGAPCTVILVVNGRDVKSWDICEGANPDFGSPDWAAR